MGPEVISAGLVDTAQAARQAGTTLASARVDLVMLYTATYATSSHVLPSRHGSSRSASGTPVH
jgi:L-arabinose isomerase